MKLKRMLSIFVVIALIGTIVACSSGGGDTAEKPPESKQNNQGNTDNNSNQKDNKKYTITWFDGTWGSPGDTPPDSEGVKAINEKFNVDFQPQYVPFEEYGQKLPVKMAAGDLPDVIGMEGADANYIKWAQQGAFLPLDEFISKYETFKIVPDYVYDGVKVDGKVYAIPRYFPTKYGKKPLIRKDWLDNLGLSMPTSYEELKQVAIAFTKNDPDKNGKDDTYGIDLAKGIVYSYAYGTYWDDSWYHKDASGNYIPGNLSEGSKQRIQFLADMYQAGALPKDWAVTKIQDVFKKYYSGKFGIHFNQPYDVGESNFKTLAEINPNAQLVPIPPFKAPDGSQGFTGLPGYYQMFMISAKLKDDPGKVKRIMEMIDYFRKFIPVDQRNPQNADFDWQNGHEGKGYKMVDGKVTGTGDENAPKGLRPNDYIENRYWAPSNEANEISKVTTHPLQHSFVSATEELLKNTKFYVDPINRVHSPKYMAQWSELSQYITEEQTKMIVGQRPISDWDKMVQEVMNKGGKEVIEEVNKYFKDAGVQGEWN